MTRNSPARPGFDESSWALLAGVRFVLAMIVFTRHLPQFAPQTGALAVLLPLGGKAAVLGFLLISGVSIGHSYTERPSGFFARRFLRIYPLYFVAVCFSEWLLVTLGSPYPLPGWALIATGWKTSVGNLFFLQGFACIPITADIPLWTISLEVFYYALTPLFARLGPLALTFLIAISMGLFAFFPHEWIFGFSAARFAWPWLIGFLYIRGGDRRLPLLLMAAGLPIVAASKADTSETLSWVTVAAAAAITFAAGVFRLPPTLRRVLNYLGELSYPLYLFHTPLCLFLYHFAGVRTAWPFLILVLLLTAILNFVFDHLAKDFIWKPMLRWIAPGRKPDQKILV